MRQGWYFWKKREDQRDPFRWTAFYIEGEGESCWEGGTAVEFPKGGWWSQQIHTDALSLM